MSTTDLANPLANPTTLTDSVSGGLAGSGNYYNFTISSETIFAFTTLPSFVQGVSKGDSDLNLYQIVSGSPELVSSSDGSTGEKDVINTVLQPGDYQIEVLPFIGNVNYSLTIKQFSQLGTDYSDSGLNNSYSLGAIDWGNSIDTSALPDHQLVSKTNTVIDFLQHRGDLDDAYSFTVDKPTTITATLIPDANSNVDLALYDDQGNQITGSFSGSGVADVVTANLKAGTYWVDASFISSNNPQDVDTGAFIANYDLSMSAKQYVLPTTVFRNFNGNATALAETFNFNNSAQPETLSISNAVYSGKIQQAAVVNNFAGEKNAGILLTTGSAKNILGHTYNEMQGSSTGDTETVKNWSNTGDGSNTGGQGNDNVSMQSLDSVGNAAGYNQDVFDAVSGLVDKQISEGYALDPITAVYDAAGLSFDVTVSGNADHISFDLEFASEEFSLFADKYVDSAVIMVDGVNYALFDPNDSESLLSVTQTNVDAGYFHPNTQLADGTSVYPTEFNGVSKLISVLAPIDTTKTTHHISIAIADTNDHVLDSGVFLTNLDSVDLSRPVPGLPDLHGREGLYTNKAGTAGTDNIVGSDNRDYSNLGAGNDKLDAGAGDDVVVSGTGNDNVVAGDGSDLVVTGTGNDVVNGGTGADEIEGGAGKDKINGGTGNDVISGGNGSDVLTGGSGKDAFELGSGVDKITDFQHTQDKVVLPISLLAEIGVKTGMMSANFFTLGTEARDENDYLIYDATTGNLFYDPDGTGPDAQVQIGLLGLNSTLTNTDVLVQ